MKLKDIFKIAVVGAAGYFGNKILPGAGGQIGKSLATSLMSPSSTGSSSQRFVPRGVNLRQFGMPIRSPAGSAESTMPRGALQVANAEGLNMMWENRLNKYLIRKKALSEKTVVKT